MESIAGTSRLLSREKSLNALVEEGFSGITRVPGTWQGHRGGRHLEDETGRGGGVRSVKQTTCEGHLRC